MVKYSNISVLLTHEFMNSVKANSDFELKYDGKVYKKINAKKLWDKIIKHAHSSAEPEHYFGIPLTITTQVLFSLSLNKSLCRTTTTRWSCCNLGAVNLERFVDQKEILTLKISRILFQ